MPRYCTECGRKILILTHPGRNPNSFHRHHHKAMKDHDLCRQCFRTMMQRARIKDAPLTS